MLRYAKYVAQEGLYGKWEIVLDGKNKDGVRENIRVRFCNNEEEAKELVKRWNPKKKKKRRRSNASAN